MMGEGTGFAKAILFGEHFVVQGTHALGASLSKELRVRISPAEKLSLNIETGTIAGQAWAGAQHTRLRFPAQLQQKRGFPLAGGRLPAMLMRGKRFSTGTPRE